MSSINWRITRRWNTQQPYYSQIQGILWSLPWNYHKSKTVRTFFLTLPAEQLGEESQGQRFDSAEDVPKEPCHTSCLSKTSERDLRTTVSVLLLYCTIRLSARALGAKAEKRERHLYCTFSAQAYPGDSPAQYSSAL